MPPVPEPALPQEPPTAAALADNDAIARILASLDDLRASVAALAERTSDDTPRLLTAAENLSTKLDAAATRMAEDTPRVLTVLDSLGVKLDANATTSREDAPRLLAALGDIAAQMDANATTSREDAPRLLAALGDIAAQMDANATTSREDAPRLLAALGDIAAQMDVNASTSREDAPRLLAALGDIAAQMDVNASTSREDAPRLLAALGEISAKLDAAAASSREDAPRLFAELSGLGTKLDTIWGHVTGARITVDQLRTFGDAVRDKALVEELTSLLAADARQALPWGEKTGDVDRLKAAMKFETSWERQGSALARMLDAAGGAVTQVADEVATVVLDRLVSEGKGRKLKSLYGEVTDRSLLAALKREVSRRREQAVLQAVKAHSVEWGTPLTKELQLGQNADERIVEIPLAVELLRRKQRGAVLDAGASLNLPYLWDAVGAPAEPVVHYTFSADQEPVRASGAKFSYYFGDLRSIPFRDGTFGRVVCISTLEHVGKDNRKYGGPEENDPRSYMVAVRELLRVLAPGGTALITVPYGVAHDYGWYQVFGQREFRTMVGLAAGYDVEAHYYYYDGFWYQAGEKPEAPSTPEVATEQITGMAALLVTKRV